MKLKNILCITIIFATLQLQAASNQSSYDLSALTRYLTTNNNSSQEQTNTQQNSFANQSTLATLNTLLNSTPDSFKSTVLDKIPTSCKIYLVNLIEFIKSYLNDENKQNLQKIQNILQQNIAATQQQHTAAFEQTEQ
jgi:hypothetical protein